MNSHILDSNKKVRLALAFLMTFFLFVVINVLFKSYFGGEIQLTAAITGGIGLAAVMYLFDREKEE